MLPEIVHIARCPEHGLHGARTECFDCGGPVDQVPMVQVAASGESFAPEDLVSWAEMYGHPEEWAKAAQAAHTRAENAEAIARQLRADIDRLERRLAALGSEPVLPAEDPDDRAGDAT